MEKLKLNGLGSWDIPSMIRNAFVYIWNELSNKINEIIDNINNGTESAPPQELVYKALLTQIGTDAPIAKVLNSQDNNYLGDLVFSYILPGIYGIPNLTDKLATIFDSGMAMKDTNEIFMFYDENIPGFTINTTTAGGLLSGDYVDEKLINFPIEIKVRQRGEAPEILEASGTSYTVLVTFSKEINTYNFSNLLSEENIIVTGQGENAIPFISFEKLDNNRILFGVDDNLYSLNTELPLNIKFPSSIIESMDLGILSTTTFPILF